MAGESMFRTALFLPPQEVLPHFEDRHKERLRLELPGIEWHSCSSEEGFLQALPGCSAAVVWRFEPEWLAEAGRLRLIATPAAGREWIRLGGGPGPEVWFGTFHGRLMAETVLGMILAFAKGIRLGLERQRDEPWARRTLTLAMRPVAGTTAVIVGFGHIGKWIGRTVKKLGVRIVGVNRSDMMRPDYFGDEDGVVPLTELDAVLPHCDHLILALPGISAADGVVDARRLALLPERACLYNVGRGNAVAMPALVEALRTGRLAGAGLDVYDIEPLPADHPIRQCPNTILLPHVSAFSPTYLDLYLDEFIPKIRAFATTDR